MSALTKTNNILCINSSYRKNGSKSNLLTQEVIKHYQEKSKTVVKYRNLESENKLNYLNEEWITANLTKEKTDEHKKILQYSDELISEIKNADVIVFGCPMYNFTISSNLKSYIDLICRYGLTFNYGEKGPYGLLENKKAIICTTSNGVPYNCEYDFVSKYMIQVCNFIGIKDCKIIHGNELLKGEEDVIEKCKKIIKDL